MRSHLVLLSIPLIALSMTAHAQTPAAQAAAPQQTSAPQSFAYPVTEKGPVTDDLFGVAVADPYRWLEDDVRVNPKVAAWVAAQNQTTDAYLATIAGRDTLKARMTALYDYERFGLPQKAGERYFYSRNDGLQPQSVLYVRDGLKGEGRVLIDPNLWAKDGATALAEWAPSEDGQYLLYAVQDGGSDWRTVRVKNVATGEDQPDVVEWVKFSALSWAKDGSGFYYSRFPQPDAEGAFQDLNRDQAIYFHRLGTDQSADLLVHATPEDPELNNIGEVTDDGKYLLTYATKGTDARIRLVLYPITAQGVGAPKTIFPNFTHSWAYVANEGTRFIFQTNKDAPRERLIALDINNPSVITELVPERAATLASASRVGDRLILTYMEDAKSKVEMVALDGRSAGEVALADIGTAAGFSGNPKDSESFYAFHSFARPATIYRFNSKTGASEIFAAPKLAFNPDDFAVEQRFFASKDGTKIPMFVVAKKGVDRAGGSPTLMYGYGGFNVSLTPSFSPTWLSWIEQGGVLAMVNLRGGGEYGKAWHDGGRLANKQNVFDDFIAAGEYLKAQGITGADQLAIEGGSNGGLLMGAVVNQRPDLFAAALPEVGVMDMIRFPKFTAGRYWKDDYGDPEVEADFRNLLRYSPYHNIKAGQNYPAILVTTADTDDRVVPGHSFKYVAALQAADIGSKPHLIRIETRAGHGSGKPVDKIIAEASDKYAFAAHFTGLTIRAQE